MSRDTWPEVLRALVAGDDLTADEAAWALNEVMDGLAAEAQVAGLIVALRAKGESADEVRGLVAAMLAHAQRIVVEQPALDIVGTGGDGSHSVNISTMSAVVAAAAGARVVKHGSRAASSRCGSADVLEALGVVADLGPEAVVECVETLGIGFCFAPRFHPAMKYAAPARRALGIPTVFNVLGPLANPAAPAAALVGCAELRLAPVMATVLASAGQRAIVVRGRDGLDEVSTADITDFWDVTGGDVVQGALNPAELGFAPAPDGALRGGDAAYNAAVARTVLTGDNDESLAPVRDSVILNAAVALVADAAARHGATSGTMPERVAAQVARARGAIESGAAIELLTRWVEVSRDLASREA